MVRNEYRRAFIMLRAATPGYGGHVRLERRTLTGSLYFIITAPQGVNELSAALVGQRNGEYFAAPIGPLSRDRRGQLALAWQFDPRSIDGRPLEAYAWIAVVATGGPCALVLTGNVEGSRVMDPEALGRAACALFTPANEPAVDLPDPDELLPGGDTAEAALPEAEPPAPEAPAPEPAEEVMRGDVKIYTRSRTRLRSAQRRRAERPSQDDAAGETPSEATPEGGGATPEAPAEAVEAPAQPVTAAQRLGLDITQPWPGATEGLRRLFATQAPLETSPEDGYTYVRAPLPQGSGYDASLVGIRAENGRAVGLRYALPARRSPEPPAGLEGYSWMPGEGEAGYWVAEGTME